jgi:CHAD domain-containing protein
MTPNNAPKRNTSKTTSHNSRKSKTAVPGMSPASILEQALKRALRKHKRASKDLSSKAVHDMRVALRRCRSLTEGYAALDTHGIWKRVDKICKKQQRGLAELRDVQVMDEWLQKLRLLGSGTAGTAVQARLKKDEKRARRAAAKSLRRFPRGQWKKWHHKLPGRAELIPVGDARLAALVLDRVNAARQLERRWRKAQNEAAWHKLRISVKRFRYALAVFLPEQHEAWKAGLKRVLKALGEAHDLDVLRDWIVEAARKDGLSETVQKRWLAQIERTRDERQQQYESAMLLTRSGNNQMQPDGKAHGAEVKASAGEKPRMLWDRWAEKLEELAPNSNSPRQQPVRGSKRAGRLTDAG